MFSSFVLNSFECMLCDMDEEINFVLMVSSFAFQPGRPKQIPVQTV